MPCSSAPNAHSPCSVAPFVAVVRRMRNRLAGLGRALGGKSALISIVDFDAAKEHPILTQSHVSRATERIVFPSALPSERCAAFGGSDVYVGQQAVHSKLVASSGYREYGGAKRIEILINPLGSLKDAPPAVKFRMQFVAHQDFLDGSR